MLGVASEHDEVAGTERGPNTIFVFELDGLRVAHFGDFGQRQLREEQAAAIGAVDLLFLPVGGGPTTSAPTSSPIARRSLSPRCRRPPASRAPPLTPPICPPRAAPSPWSPPRPSVHISFLK
ncbi:MAG TPA: MBL fold metallo-hydrolase [Solirubrobacterales bacterium]|nr:MBL fold metallo-hydrolase [Solirubrobacterales bacterium]